VTDSTNRWVGHAIIQTKYLTGIRSDVRAKRRKEPIEEDGPEITVIKAQKLTEHEGRPHARDYDDIMQEFVVMAIEDYQARLCAECPMPDHVQETALMNTSWAKVFQITGVNLVQTPQLSKLISSLLAVSLCYFYDI